jgi:hypothetical protein
LTIYQLTNESCRWPLGLEDLNAVAVEYCGKPEANAIGNRPYCPEHEKKAYNKPPRQYG